MNIFLILSILFFILTIVGLWKCFEKAGQKGWIVLIPFYNFYIWLKIIRKPMWWYIFIIFPFINVFTILLMVVELVKCFNKFGLGEQAIATLFPFIYLPYIGFSKKDKYTDPDKRQPVKKTVVREWADAIIFAVIAATIIRTFLIEAYTIPTSSMEKSLLVGDFLFVSKISYGPKVPNTPLSFPFAHHTLPLTQNIKSYLEWIKLPYYRFPGFTTVKRYDAVVFNYPDGDTVCTKIQSNASYYALIREYGRYRVWNDKETFGDVIARPVDKKENFIKRCIGLPGDNIQIVDRKVFVNGKEETNPGIKQFKYVVTTDGSQINPKMLERLDVTEDVVPINNYQMLITLTDEGVKAIRNFVNVKDVKPYIKPKGAWEPYIFPFDSTYRWNEDNFGPVYIPKAGATVKINKDNIMFYERIIGVFEKNKLEVNNGKILINGKECDSYTFKMNYYWMMGDNRHNSADSRFWGFVPEDHVVGKAVFVWLSLDKNKSLFDGKLRWRKMFRLIK